MLRSLLIAALAAFLVGFGRPDCVCCALASATLPEAETREQGCCPAPEHTEDAPSTGGHCQGADQCHALTCADLPVTSADQAVAAQIRTLAVAMPLLTQLLELHLPANGPVIAWAPPPQIQAAPQAITVLYCVHRL